MHPVAPVGTSVAMLGEGAPAEPGAHQFDALPRLSPDARTYKTFPGRFANMDAMRLAYPRRGGWLK